MRTSKPCSEYLCTILNFQIFLFDDDIISCLETQIKNRKIENLQNASNCLSMSAEIKGYDPTYNSPFAIEAKAAGRKFKGGKADDITVIVAQI